ncbi:hypothetical protein E3T37_08215 [Cryobacterium sp. TMT2-10]|nr:hypothetical protein E3T37_08215 [Cryobacterium sp. TMT2-10]
MRRQDDGEAGRLLGMGAGGHRQCLRGGDALALGLGRQGLPDETGAQDGPDRKNGTGNEQALASSAPMGLLMAGDAMVGAGLVCTGLIGTGFVVTDLTAGFLGDGGQEQFKFRGRHDFHGANRSCVKRQRFLFDFLRRGPARAKLQKCTRFLDKSSC